MRTIKFRGKRLDTGEWTVGGLVTTIHGHYGIATMTRYDTDLKNIGALIDEVDPATVGQFTGLLDKNGREIYEGDILGCIPNIVHEVRWAGCSFRQVASDNYDGGILSQTYVTEFEKEVISNIHDQKR